MRLLLQGRVPSRRDNAAVKKNGTLNEFRLQPVIGPISGFPPAERQPEFISSFFFRARFCRGNVVLHLVMNRSADVFAPCFGTVRLFCVASPRLWKHRALPCERIARMQLWCRNIPDERATAWLRVSLGLEGRAEESAAVNHRGVLDL